MFSDPLESPATGKRTQLKDPQAQSIWVDDDRI